MGIDETSSKWVTGDGVGVKNNLECLLASSTEVMAFADICEASGLVQNATVKGQAVGGIIANTILVKLTVPVEKISNKSRGVGQYVVLCVARREAAR